MMKFIDWISSKLSLSKKENFDYECTYAWSVLAKALLVVFFTLSMAIIVVYINLVAFSYESMKANQYITQFMKKDMDLNLLRVVTIFLNISVINLLSFTNTKMRKVVNRVWDLCYMVLNKSGFVLFVILSPLIKVLSIINRNFYGLMEKYCTKVLK